MFISGEPFRQAAPTWITGRPALLAGATTRAVFSMTPDAASRATHSGSTLPQ